MTHLPGSRGNRYRNPRFPTGEANLRLPFQAEQPQYNVHPMEYCARVTCPPNVVPNYNPQMRPPFPGPDSMTYSPPVLNHLDPLYSEQSTRFTIPPPIPSAQVYVPPYQTPQSTLHTWSSEQVPGNNCTSFPQNSVSSTAETWHNTVPFPEEVPKELIRPKLEQLVPILWHSKKEPKFEVDKIGENTYPPIFKDATDIRVKQEYTSPDNCEEKGNNTPSRRKSNSPLSRQRTPPLSNQIREPSSKQRSRTPTPRRRSKSPSSIRSSKTSSTRQSSRTPSSRRSRTPSKQRSRTPSRRRSRTPSRRRLKTPSRRRSRTPSRQRTRTPSRRRSRTPSRRRSRTPLRRRSRTPSRRRSRTPSRRRSRTASRRRSRTPSRQRSRTASRRRSRTPSRRRSRTPSRRRSRTPSRRRSRTPSSRLGSRSRSPLSRFSSKTHSSRCHSKTPPSRRRSKRALSRHRSKTPRSRRRSRTPLSRRKQRSRSLSCRRGRRSRDRSSNYDRSRRSYSLSRAQSSRSRKRSTSSRRTATKSDTRQSHSSDSDKGYSQTKKSYSRSPDFHNSKENLESPPANTTASQGPEDEASRSFSPAKTLSERQCVLEKYRMDYCANSAEMHRKLEEISRLKPEEIVELEKKVWTRTAPADLFYARENNSKVMRATQKLIHLCERFRIELLERAATVRSSRPAYEPPPRKNRMRLARHKSELCSSSESLSDESTTDEEDCTMEELERKRLHPYRLHPEMWYNDSGEMNDGPLCRCSAKARRYGIRHGIYAGESHLPKCEMDTNNADRLFHYRITISPPTNFLTKTPTIIKHDEHEFIFEGFSMFSHFPLDQLPTCKVIRFNIEYTILYIDEKLPENFTIRELDLFYEYLFHELLELVDLDFKAHGDSTGCSQFHFMPRFVRDLQDNGKEILSMNEVMQYLIQNSKPLIEEAMLNELLSMPQFKWQNFADEVKGMVVTYPGMKPCSVRVDQLDRDQQKIEEGKFPEIVHFGIRPPQLSYAGNPEYQKSWREYVKFRHLLANMPKPSFEDKRKLESKENKLQDMRTQSKMKRDVTVAVSASGFHRTGIMCDIIQHAMLIPVLVCHLRFHRSCNVLEKVIGYKFKNRFLLQLALTHPSYRENFGTNPDHARNSLTNCGIRQPEYGDRRIHYMNTRKRGINTLINIMSRFGKKTATESNITHNERLEFLGDAVVEFLTSIHLFHMFPDLEEGGLATYRAAIVQNQHLAVLAKTLNLEEFMLYAHGSDLCHDLELRHAMANCFEALMGALFLDGGIEVADKVFGETLFKDEANLLDIWVNYPPHPLQEQEPLGDRKWIPSFELLQNLTKFEDSIGVEFKHIRLLARAFTDRSIGYTNLTLGSNQRLEFLGDTVLQLIASEYLYKYFPEHHEGHLSLLRSSLVNNRTQAVVCDDLGMIAYALYSNPKVELKTKDRADLLEAFLGALYVDKGLDFCHTFCDVCFFPRLQDFIMNQDWNDPKSKLQQCCLTLRTMEGGEPDIPVYKVIECKGPTNTRVYTVAVYFRGARLAKASGHSIQQAEMNAAKNALEKSQDLFPQLDHQKRVIAKSLWRQQRWPSNSDSRSRSSPDREMPSTSRDRSKSSSHSIKGKMSSRDRRKGKSSRHKKSASKEPVPSSSRSSIKNKKSIPDKNGKDTIDTISPPSCKNKMKKIDINCGGNVDSNHNNDDNDDHNNDDDDDHDNDDDDDDDGDDDHDNDDDDDDDDNDDVSSDDDIYGK